VWKSGVPTPCYILLVPRYTNHPNVGERIELPESLNEGTLKYVMPKLEGEYVFQLCNTKYNGTIARSHHVTVTIPAAPEHAHPAPASAPAATSSSSRIDNY
jgi:hypothetical protein